MISLENNLGCVYLKKIDVGSEPLGAQQAKSLFKKYFVDKKSRIKLSTHANGTLTIGKIKSILQKWKREGFIPDLILIDYADLIVSNTKVDVRHQIDGIWKQLRGLSQEYNCLIVSPTQADAKSYETDLLTLKNFSEDKRKFAHVTAMYD